MTPSIGPAEGGEVNIICNDASGLCLARTGSMNAGESGVYTNLARLASQLQEGESSSDAPPLIIIEIRATAILIREYGGQNAVAIKVPRTTGTESNAESQDED